MEKIRFGIVGIGMMGRMHATSLQRNPHAEVVAVCARTESKVKAFQEEFGVPYGYTNVDELVNNPEVDAIVVATGADAHKAPCLAACKAKKHIFCEKPLATTLEDAKKVVEAEKASGKRLLQIGFMRRFDKSYAEAKRKIDNGDIGKVVLVRSYTQDPRSTIESTLKFAPHSGGQYLDMCVHDIDLIRWFTGSDVKNVWAIGGVFEFDLYKELNDADNAAATIQMENGAMGFMFTNRTHAAGCNVETEIIGTHGTLRIANVGAKNLLNIVDEHGSREEYYPDFMSRWHEAFVAEMVAFTGHVRDNTKPADLTVYDGTAVSEAAYRCKESFETGKMLPIR